MKPIMMGLVFAMSSLALAAEPDAVAKKEIGHLMGHLASSGCQFNRNGAWHGSAQAVDHLNRKYEYLLERKLAPTAEAFIERAASKSSVSGKPYLVKCNGQPEVKSAAWFRAELARFREESGNGTKHR